ncbi:MAG TPA: pantoate--beta-alanine ligase [Gammaproteobacteria bacterium]|nr:pantoate--beta-alanine ligase [Gammaproteobacteria bacterium]
MEILRDTAAMAAAAGRLRAAGRLAFVPTMGNLHAGHLALVEEARRRADAVAASIFVNPMQFNDPADYAAYPRTFEADAARLEAAGVSLLFAPEAERFYPRPLESLTRVVVPGLSEILCGAHRPGHFTGVATVVIRLFHIVRPHVAVFGEKDYQQLLLVRRMVEDLAMDVEVVGVPTVREADGLAMSSRNRYLSSAERARAPALYRALRQVVGALEAGRRDYPALEAEASASMERAGLRPEYCSIRRAADLLPPQPDARDLVVLAAAWLGSARLIDNLQVRLP